MPRAERTLDLYNVHVMLNQITLQMLGIYVHCLVRVKCQLYYADWYLSKIRAFNLRLKEKNMQPINIDLSLDQIPVRLILTENIVNSRI